MAYQPHLALPETLKAAPTDTDKMEAIESLMETLEAHVNEGWAKDLLDGDFGKLAPATVREIDEAIRADATLVRAWCERLENDFLASSILCAACAAQDERPVIPTVPQAPESLRGVTVQVESSSPALRTLVEGRLREAGIGVVSNNGRLLITVGTSAPHPIVSVLELHLSAELDGSYAGESISLGDDLCAGRDNCVVVAGSPEVVRENLRNDDLTIITVEHVATDAINKLFAKGSFLQAIRKGR